ncbi:MAG: hypothetical protein CVV25_14760, partial [Ignavibacteriae bacterium HGW-Ignavibacteriae-4]
MKFLTTSIIILLLTFSSLFSGIDVDEVKEKLAMIQNSGNSGRDFWFTIPPIYTDESSGKDNFVKILVTSSTEANVEVSIGSNGYFKKNTVEPFSVVSFNLVANTAQPISHSGINEKQKPAKVYKNSAIHVVSDVPVIVYVVVKYQYSSDGFFAIPAKAFGTKYINSAYKEPAITINGWFSPFTGVVAAYDNTNVTFTMGGGDEGNDAVPFNDGSLIKSGESKSALMSRGDVWLLSINGPKQDLSGSLFEGNKPFGIVSGVNCALIPLGVTSCDYIVNMELPTIYWQKDYFITPQMNKKYNGIIRIYASEPNTNVYKDGKLIGTIKKGGGASLGEGFIETRLWPLLDEADKTNPPKLAHINADKPIAVVYYNTGNSEDDIQANSDPFMMQIPAIEQSVTNAVVFSPNETKGLEPFNENYINITFPLIDNEIPDDLLFAELSVKGNEPKYRKVKDVYGDKFEKFESTYNGRSYASKRLSISTEGSYIIKSDSTKFLTESFGFKNSASYGFPSAFSLNDYSLADSVAPQVKYTQQCNGDISKDGGTVTDYPEDDAARSNMRDIFVVAKDNYQFDWRAKSSEFIPGEQRELNWWLTVIDKSKPASALIYFSDMAGNDTTILVTYVNTEMEATSTSISLQNPKIKEVTFQDTIRNLSNSKPIYLSRIEFGNKKSGFSVVSFEPSNWDISMPILPNSEIYVNVNFTKDNIDNSDIYSDSLFVGLGINNEGSIEECQYYPIANQRVSADFPLYEFVSYSNFGELDVESKPIKLQDTIRNLSSQAPLYVSSLEFKYGDKGFSLGGFTPFSWDMTKPIAPNAEVLVDIIFNPKSVEQGEEDIEYIDSLGIGISVMNAINELEELEFSYKTVQKAIIKAKGISSVTPEQTLSEYMTLSESSVQILPQAIADGFTELTIFNLEGSKVISTDIQNQN